MVALPAYLIGDRPPVRDVSLGRALDPRLAAWLKGCAWCGKLVDGLFEDYTCVEGHCTGHSRYHRECLKAHEKAMGHVREGVA